MKKILGIVAIIGIGVVIYSTYKKGQKEKINLKK